MSRKSRRELERELEKLREMLNDDNDDNDDEITVTSEVVTITPDMVDDNGNTIESKIRDLTAPEVSVPSDVVTVSTKS